MYAKAIKVGIGGGIVTVLLLIIQNVANLLFMWQAAKDYGSNYMINDRSLILLLITLLDYLLYAVDALVLLVVGALAVRMATPALNRIEDVAVVSATSGAIASLIWGLAKAAMGIISTFVLSAIAMPNFSDTAFGSYATTNVYLLSALVGGLFNLICCLPVFLMFGTVIALIGGVVYAALAQIK